MTHKQRILADRILAVPMAFAFNAIARLLGKLLRRDHSVTRENVKVIVVAKFLGMGSILQSVPLLRALKRHYPNAKLIFVTMKANRELVSRLPLVDELLVLDDRSAAVMAATTLRTIATLIVRRADLYFDLEVYSGFASLLALWAVTRNRLGFYRHSTAFKKGIYTHLVYFNTHMPVRQLYLQLGRTAGIPKEESELTGPIVVHDYERETVARLLAKIPGWRSGEPYIVVNPNASDLMLERRWPVEHAVEAISRLVSGGNQIALIGSRGEVDFVHSLCNQLPAEVRSTIANTAGQLTLGELLALISGAACVLTNDTGPMHMSIALERPTVCLFGPVNPAHYGHDLPFVDIFYEQVFCSPCLHELDEPPCNGNNVCMQRIEPGAVVEAIQHLARTGLPRRKRQRQPFLEIQTVSADTAAGSPLGVAVRASIRPSGEGVEIRCDACSTLMAPAFSGAVANHWRCPECGLERIWPQPDDRSLSSMYNDRYFSHYQSTIDPQLTRSMKRATFDRQLELLASVGPIPAKRRLLDCGAATGILAERARERGWDAFAIEVSDFGAEACAELLGPDHVHRGDVQSACFAANPESRFEVITMCDFIEHVRNPREVLRWARQHLAPGGVLLLTTPQVRSISWKLMGRHWFHYVPEHLWLLSSQSIRTLLNESGFESAAVSPLGKTVAIEYALAYYERSSSESRLFSPVARLLRHLLPAFIRRQSFRFYLGEMVVTARAGAEDPARVGDSRHAELSASA